MSPATTTDAALVEVAEDVYAYTQLPGGWCVSNAGVVAGSDGVLVVDTLATEHRARRLRAAVDGLRAGPRRTVVNTHHHGDHNFGNRVFGPGAAIVAHEAARTEMAATGLALTGLWPDVAWGEVAVTLPTTTFADRLTVHVGGRAVRLLHVGPAHTTNDVVAWLPEDRVLFAGDVVLSGATPFSLMGSVAGTLAAIERLRDLGARTVVCGHGPVAGPEVFDENAAYLRWVQRLAADGVAAGLRPLEVAAEAGPGEFGHLLDPERVVGNLHRAYAEVEGGPLGRPLDVVSVFGEMVAHNDGRLPTCLA
ncbi:MBL fold metallo-hydrolase [Saccharothrix syringae]|uniref:MBL fold metallo-hydrolase n=1 Tax=Saccharothrix syringae TaxID=103733 RepID=A0A5Q0GZI4_SACSY|nr:MBL fold metallo-hydrolase [Saccharothrix syringae]QFZ18802.1 MBL fold metallo-hydrolase [Saccharothrix syringae]